MPITEQIHKEVLSLPINPLITHADSQVLVEIVNYSANFCLNYLKFKGKDHIIIMDIKSLK